MDLFPEDYELIDIFESEPTPTNNPSIFADHITDKYMGRVTVWQSGAINVEILAMIKLIFNNWSKLLNKHNL